MTTTRIATLVVLVFACSGVSAAQQPPIQPTPSQAEPSPERWYVEYSLNGGNITATREIAINENATGDHERLFARLKSSLFVGGKVGAHGNRLGIEAGVFRTAEKIQVNNEFGVHFPNHGENITFVKSDLLVYLFPRSAFDGVFRPYISTGFGGAFFSIDTDNINDQENYVKPTASIGGGGKFKLGGSKSNVGFEVLLRYEQMFGKAPIQTVGFVMVSAGFVFTQFREAK